jgi:hypothetical protein
MPADEIVGLFGPAGIVTDLVRPRSATAALRPV